MFGLLYQAVRDVYNSMPPWHTFAAYMFGSIIGSDLATAAGVWPSVGYISGTAFAFWATDSMFDPDDDDDWTDETTEDEDDDA